MSLFYCWDPSEPRATAQRIDASDAKSAAYQFAMSLHEGEEMMVIGVAVTTSLKAEPDLFMARVTVQIDCEIERPSGDRLKNMRETLKGAK